MKTSVTPCSASACREGETEERRQHRPRDDAIRDREAREFAHALARGAHALYEMAVGSFGAQAARAVEPERERAERDVAICREERNLAACVRRRMDIAGIDVVAAPTVAFPNQFMRRLEFRRRFGGRDADVGKSHRGQCACRAPGDGLPVRMCGNSAARHSTVATTTARTRSEASGEPQEIPPATCGHHREMQSKESFALAARSFTHGGARAGNAGPRSGRLGAWQWRSAWEADPRCTRLAKHRNCRSTALTAMQRLPSMQTVRCCGQIRRDQKRNIRDCRVPVQAGSSVSVDNLGSRRANAPPLSGIAQYHSTHSVAYANESPSIRIRRKAHTRRLPFDYNFCRLQK